MLEIGDNSGDDPSSLSNRYLLAIALQGAKRDDESAANTRRLERNAASQAGCSRRLIRTVAEVFAYVGTKTEDGSSAPPAALSENAIADATPFPGNGPLSEQDATALKSLNDDVQLARAHSFLARGKYAEAIAPLQIYLATPRKDADAERARSELAICFATVARHAEAQQALAELKSNDPGSTFFPATTERVAQSLYAAGMYKAAAPLFRISFLGELSRFGRQRLAGSLVPLASWRKSSR